MVPGATVQPWISLPGFGRWGSLPALGVLLVFVASDLSSLGAQEPSAVEAVSQLQGLLVNAIAGAEKSVVAIARVRKGDRSEPGEVLPGRFDRLRLGGDVLPTDPDFVPHEYGAGVVVDRQGLILTTYHVLGEIAKNDYYVWSGRRPFAATVHAADPWFDLAVLKIEATDLKPIPLGNAAALKKGQIAVLLGNPQGIARDGEASAAWGMIANLARKAPARNPQDDVRAGQPTLHHYGTLIQVDARASAVSSGGALVNLKGELVGLLTALPGELGESAGGFAIPVDDAFLRSLEKLKAGKKPEYGFLGVAPDNLALAERQQGKFGAKVRQAVPGAPADLSGIQSEDAIRQEVDVITHVNDRPVYDSSTLILELSRLPAGDTPRLTLERGRRADANKLQQVSVLVPLWKKPLAGERPAVGEEAHPIWRGMRVDYASAIPAFREPGGDFDPQGCVGVAAVEPGTPAWVAGLRAGMFITHANEKRVVTPDEFHAAAGPVAQAVSVRVAGFDSGARQKLVQP